MNKPRICIFSIFDEPYSGVAEVSVFDNFKDYCDLYGYDLKYKKVTAEDKTPIYNAANYEIATAWFKIKGCLDILETNQYDGVDIDWEFPSSESDRKNLSIFINDLRSAMDDTGEYYLLSMAISSGSWSGQWFEYDELSKYLDWFGVMTYDYHGSWTNHAGHNSPM